MPNDLAYEMLKQMQQMNLHQDTGPFRGIGDLINFIGSIVVGGFILLWFLRKAVMGVIEYVREKRIK